MTAETPTKLPYYVTDKGLLVNLKIERPDRLRINDVEFTPTFNPRWWVIKGENELRSYSVHAGTRSINQRFVLVNDTVQGLPKVIPASQVEKDDDYEWTGQYAGLTSLYRYESDTEDLGFQTRPFEGQHLGSVILDNLGDPTGFSYKLHGTGFLSEQKFQTKAIGYLDIFQEYEWATQSIQVDDIAKAMTPDVAWHLYPCSISSETAYRIVRAYVKDHIDPMYAEVTSDYDFCFTAEKKIRIVPYPHKREQLTSRLKSYHPPRFVTSTVEYEKRKVFEMTHAKAKYDKYPVIAGFSADSLSELAQVIDQYLHDLMAVINAPLTKCQHCDGLGVTDYHKLPTNERDALKMQTKAEARAP